MCVHNLYDDRHDCNKNNNNQNNIIIWKKAIILSCLDLITGVVFVFDDKDYNFLKSKPKEIVCAKNNKTQTRSEEKKVCKLFIKFHCFTSSLYLHTKLHELNQEQFSRCVLLANLFLYIFHTIARDTHTQTFFYVFLRSENV